MFEVEYVGQDEILKGETALARFDENDVFLVQFDNLSLVLSHGWHDLSIKDFKVVNEVSTAPDPIPLRF